MYDKAICINLASRPDRKKQALQEFERLRMPNVEFWQAIHDPSNGMAGLHQTMHNIFQQNSGKQLLILEDDVVFKKSTEYLFEIYNKHLPKDWYLFYLGGNATKPVIGTRFDPVRQVIGGYLTSHAILYSAQATEELAEHMTVPIDVTRDNTYDVFLSRDIQPHFPCYAAYPAIAAQSNGFSDICGFDVNYDYFHEKSKRFYK